MFETPGVVVCAGEPVLEREVSAVSSVSQGSVGNEQGEEVSVSSSPIVSTAKPAVVALPDDLTVMQVDCGAYHTGDSN